MNPSERTRLGRSTLQVSRLGLGTGPLGGARVRVEGQVADATVAAAIDAGLNYLDTAPWYGVGQAELHLGHALQALPRADLVLSTKVGRVLYPPADAAHPPYAKRWPGGAANDLRFDYTREGVLRSHADSLLRLAVEKVDVLVIHDLDFKFHTDETQVQQRLDELERGGGFAALAELKAAGSIQAIGTGINHTGMIPRFLQRFDVDFFLVAMPYTLLDQSVLDEELPMCTARGISVVIGAPFCSGLLAPGAGTDAWYGYQHAEPAVRDKVQRIDAVCQRNGVSLGAAALQFPFGHPAVAAVIPGPESPEHVASNLSLMREPIPADLWAELKAEQLLRADAPTP